MSPEHLFERAAGSAAGHLPRRKSERNARPTEIRSARQKVTGSATKVRAAAKWYRRLSKALALQPLQHLFGRVAGSAAGHLPRRESERNARTTEIRSARQNVSGNAAKVRAAARCYQTLSGALALQPHQHVVEMAAGSAAGHWPRRKNERNARPTEIRNARQKVIGSAAKVCAAVKWYRRVSGAVALQPQQHLFKRAAGSAAGHLPRRRSERNARTTEIRSARQK